MSGYTGDAAAERQRAREDEAEWDVSEGQWARASESATLSALERQAKAPARTYTAIIARLSAARRDLTPEQERRFVERWT